MMDSIDTFSFPQSITPEEINEIIVAAGAPRINMFIDVKSIAWEIDVFCYDQKSERNRNPQYLAYKKRQRDLEAAHIYLEKWAALVIEVERRNLIKYPDSMRSNVNLPKYERLKAALEETRERCVNGHTRQRGQRGASVVPHKPAYIIFLTLRRVYRRYGNRAPKDSILYEIIKNCFGKVGIVLTCDAIRKAIGKAERQRAAELAKLRSNRQARPVDPGK
jgi:hypothetical protein